MNPPASLRAAILAAAILTIAAIAAVATDSDPETPDVDKEWSATCREACGRLAGALQAELMKAMREDGPEAALAVCNEIAPAVADSLSRELGLRVGRTSLRTRNPANAPDAWERPVLEDFARRVDDGVAPGDLEYAELAVRPGGARVFRYMKGIGTSGLCLRCHGARIEEGLAARLRELYPEDAAVGFAAGDLRGAFTVSLPLPE